MCAIEDVRYMRCPLRGENCLSLIERCPLYGESAIGTTFCVLYRDVCAIWCVRYRGVSLIERCPLYGESAIEDNILCPL